MPTAAKNRSADFAMAFQLIYSKKRLQQPSSLLVLIQPDSGTFTTTFDSLCQTTARMFFVLGL